LADRTPHRQRERHYTQHAGWLRAAVLGANDGIVSTASLLVGVAAAGAGRTDLLIAGIAGLVAGAMSMAAGEYVSVSSQADIEHADLKRERREQETNPEFEHAELAEIYRGRGLRPPLADEVARELMRHDALEAHARDELGINALARARPLQAALTSGATFSLGAALPLGVAWLAPAASTVPLIAGAALVCLAGLGALAAWTGGARIGVGTLRVAFWGAAAMAATALIGKLAGTIV
jgi:VIT1/CCC1 family predicted Fe2+/Mn2+ transporter